MAGVFWLRLSLRIWRISSWPSMTGMPMSSSMRSNTSLRARARPSELTAALLTIASSASSSNCIISSTSLESSTSSTFTESSKPSSAGRSGSSLAPAFALWGSQTLNRAPLPGPSDAASILP
ncbi:hypothetical protein D3C81_1731750 [compost metagenome]